MLYECYISFFVIVHSPNLSNSLCLKAFPLIYPIIGFITFRFTPFKFINEEALDFLGGANVIEGDGKDCGNLRHCGWNSDDCPKLETCDWN